MNCPRCNSPASEETLREFGGVCPKCLLHFAEEKDAPAFPNLEIIEMIGQGGMGVVYKAIQKNLNRTVALKVLSPRLSDDPEFLSRFTREAQALAQLSHPNIVAIHDSGVHDRVPYLVMEYVEGRSLRALLQSKEITVTQVLTLIPQICDALQYAHGRGVVHRDIKPENILLDAAGRVKIADYGLAKLATAEDPRLTKSGFVMGTPHYMAPEQVENSSQVDHRADIYSLGVIFYEMLTGELPLGRFKAPSQRADVDCRLDPVVLKSLEREPDDRYQSADEVKEQVTRLRQRPIVTKSRTGYVPPEPPSPLKKAAFVLANLGGLALGASIIMSLMHASALTQLLGSVGMALLLAALVLGIIVILRHGFRKAMTGHVGWIAGLAFILLVFAWSEIPRSGPVPPPEQVDVFEQNPGSQTTHEIWREDIPGTSPVLGLLSGSRSVYVATTSELREYVPDTGVPWSSWKGAIDSLPLISDNWIALWGGGRIVILESQSHDLVEKTSLEHPFKAPVAGAAIEGGVIYLQYTTGDAVAIALETGKVLWKDPAAPGLAVGLEVPPIVTDLNVVTIHDSGMELRDRKTGVHKNHSNVVMPAGKVLQWEEGWGILYQEGLRVELKTYFKSSLQTWWGQSPTTTPVVQDCHMVLIKDLVVWTSVNQIFSFHRNGPFGSHWGGVTIPHTIGPLCTLADKLVAIPTVQGVLFFRAEDGGRLTATIETGADLTMVVGSNATLVGYDPKKKMLLAYELR
jgi:predicted Ser/Thr protein kinase